MLTLRGVGRIYEKNEDIGGRCITLPSRRVEEELTSWFRDVAGESVSGLWLRHPQSRVHVQFRLGRLLQFPSDASMGH